MGRVGMVKILLVSNIMGRKHLAYRLLPVIYGEDIDLVILAGNTGLPEIIDLLADENIHLLGITGNLDDYSIIKSLKKYDAYLDGKSVEYKGYVVAGIGVQVYNNSMRLIETGDRIDILVTFYPPLGRSIHDEFIHGSDYVDVVLDKFMPNIVIVGEAHRSPALRGNILYLGDMSHGYYTVLELDGKGFRIDNRVLL